MLSSRLGWIREQIIQYIGYKRMKIHYIDILAIEEYHYACTGSRVLFSPPGK
jgi:hypothetical protein